ncbi:hypothetical protein M407DRAFT_18619 [Tulasnella calospora MUT 4182]|uniref:LIM zinc-binding domain-containing protein n=1 Tax=Tulasnella calospora MUT 4182 TaxID=1051891 RepID=A0A0C3LF30_9AGAM|nr:hypothetical protein M407DRAFT_18619 [Tulasnella calospora MUT 4182]
MAAFAKRFLSSATTAAPSNPPSAPSSPVTPPSPTSPTSSAGPPVPRPPKGKGKPPPGPSPLSVSTIAEPTRFSQVLPGVNCKECGQSIPLDKLEEHRCPPRPPMPTLPPNQDAKGRPMSRSPSNPSIPPTQSAQAPARRPSDPPRRTPPSPVSRPPAQQLPKPPSPSARSPPDDARLRPAVENDTDRGLRRPSAENSRPKPETLQTTALGNSPIPAPHSPARSPAPAQTSFAIANDPPPHPRPSPPLPNNTQVLPDPPSPNQHSPSHAHSPQHATSPPLAQQQNSPERITSPIFEGRATRKSNSETPFYVDNGHHQQADQDVNDDAHMSMIAPDPGRDAAQVLSTYGMPIPDTQVGGEAGMAGVGRRGFAAVAQAALIVQRTGMSSAMSHHSFGGPRTPSPGVFPVDPRAVSPGLMPGFGPSGPFPPYGGPNSGPPSRMGSPNMTPMAFGAPPPPGRIGSPGQQFLGPGQPGHSPGPSPHSPPGSFGGLSPRSQDIPLPANGQQYPLDERRPSHGELPGLGLSEAGPSRSPPRQQQLNQPLSADSDDDEQADGLRPRNSRQMPKRSMTDVSHYTDETQIPMRQDSPEPMTPEEEAGLNRSDKGKQPDNRTSVASSSYTSMTIGESDRKMVSNVKTGVRNLFRKSSNHSQSSASSESSSLSVRLPFFERLKAAKKSGSQSSSGSSGTALFKSSSMRSISSTKSEIRPLGIEKALAPVQERRESSSTMSDDDVQLAYAFGEEDEPSPPSPAKPAAIPQTAPLMIRRSSQDPEGERLPHLASGAESGNTINNSIPFPSPPETAEKLKAGSPIVSHGGVRADSLETSSSSTSSSSAVSTSLLHNKNGKPVVGVQIVGAGDRDGATVRERAVGSQGLLGGDLLAGGQMDGSGMLESPTSSSPSPTSTSFSTTTGVVSAVSKMKKKKVRQCRKCSKIITDGKWVAVDVGTPEAAVLCEYDWKEDYLPKCRRCTKPIEGAVISASDGQIVGKYHRDCFTCIACSKPFPDKNFYVFDGLPHCRYHYHEANGSLCASPDCNQPIEGGCAIADDGKRYHPEHFVCEWQGGGDELPPTRRQKCEQELEDYWEFGPRKYCSERHAAWAQEKAAADKARALREGRAVTDTTDPNSRATKRRTLFVKQIAEKVEL